MKQTERELQHRRDGQVGPRDVERWLLTVAEAAAVLSVSVRTCWRLIDLGKLERVTIGRAVRVTVSSVKGLIARGGTSLSD